MIRYKMKDLCLIITDGEHGSVKDDKQGKFFFLNNNNIEDFGIVITDKDRRISQKSFDNICKRICLKYRDVVIATCGTLGKNTVIKDTNINYTFSRSVGVIRCDESKLLPEYLHYYLCLDSTQRRIESCSKGGVQKHFYITDMKDFEIDCPSLDVQKKIVGILDRIDRKMMCNKNINDNLFQSAMVA